MADKTILVTKSDTAVIECPECGVKKSVPVGRFKGSKHVMKVKCACAHVFEIQLNFRRNYRKATSLDASYYSMSSPLDGHYDNLTKKNVTSPNTTNCTVKDLSFGGIRLEIKGKHLIEAGDVLMVSFELDNAKKTRIRRKISVKRVSGNIIGAEFTGKSEHDAALGFYVMP